MTERWLTTTQAADLLSVSDASVRAMCRNGQLRCLPIGRPGSKKPRWRLLPGELEAYMMRCAQQ